MTGTVSTTDGGQASVTAPVAVDRTDPVARLRGLHHGQPRCVGTDATSAVAVCLVKRERLGGGLVKFVAIVRDRAGNVDRVSWFVRRS